MSAHSTLKSSAVTTATKAAQGEREQLLKRGEEGTDTDVQADILPPATPRYRQTSSLPPPSQPSSTSESSCFLQPDPLLCFSAPLHHPPSFNPFHACLVLSCMKPVGSDSKETAQVGKTQAIKGILQLTCPHNLRLLLEVKCGQSSVALCPHTDNQNTTKLTVVLG